MKKLKKENAWQVRTNFLNIKAFLKVKTAKKDKKCGECGIEYQTLANNGHEKIALMTFKGRQNMHLCNGCGKRYIDEAGAIDIEAQIIEGQKGKDVVLDKIKATGVEIKEAWKNKEISELEAILAGIVNTQKAQSKLEAIKFTEEELFVDDYLVKDYNVIFNANYLKSEDQIEEWFRDNYADYVDCGQGYYQEEADVLVKIGLKFFNVHVVVEIGSAKQDRGDRLFWAECFESCKWEEIEKPLKKETRKISYSLELNMPQELALNAFLKENGITNNG